MTNRPKAIGTAAESAVARFLRENGFPYAERRALRGTEDAGDITGTPGVCWEVKGGQAAKFPGDGQVDKWLRDTDTETDNAGADLGILVMQRGGYGPTRCGSWWAVVRIGSLVPSIPAGRMADTPIRMTLSAVVMFLRENGYGDPL